MSYLIKLILNDKSKRSAEYLEKISLENGIPWRD